MAWLEQIARLVLGARTPLHVHVGPRGPTPLLLERMKRAEVGRLTLYYTAIVVNPILPLKSATQADFAHDSILVWDSCFNPFPAFAVIIMTAWTVRLVKKSYRGSCSRDPLPEGTIL